MTYYIAMKKVKVIKFRKKPKKWQIDYLQNLGFTNYRILKKEPSKEKLKKLF